MTETARATVHVIGLGSLFQADDAFGPAVVGLLAEIGFPSTPRAAVRSLYAPGTRRS